jgi:hypothetical protein
MSVPNGPGVEMPAASKGSPLGSVSVYTTEIVPSKVIWAEFTVIRQPRRTNSTRFAAAYAAL